MERVWAPWRTVYVGKNQGEGCIFCNKYKDNRDAENYVLWRGEKVMVLLNIYPYTSGHLLVAPVRHVGDITELTDEESLELFQLTQRMISALRRAINPSGFNVGINLGSVAGAGIPGHFHLHIVPRWEGDNNFMPVISDTRVISEGLEMTYQKLKEALA